MFYFIKGYRASAWGSEDLNFEGNNLTNINFANIGNTKKVIDTSKYYQKSLGELASTLKICKNFSVTIFKPALLIWRDWKFLSDAQKTRILDILSEGKGIILYEKIVTMNSLFCTPENGTFFKKN